jgi:protein-L-isoaspartate(D-aspartate) O-methyltransferase
MDRLEAHRNFFASLITASAGAQKDRLAAAFAATPRERYVGPGPWKVFAGGSYIETPSEDPAFLYQDIVVALSEAARINNGQPMLHAICLATLNLKEGETILHIGAGTGYYTAVMAQLAGAAGRLFAYEIDSALARRAMENLAGLPNVSVEHRSGAEGELPACDAIYVNAAATAPLDIWLDALRPGARLLMPLTPDGPGGTPGAGAMLLVTRSGEGRLDARFVMPVMFTPCLGARDNATAGKLAEAFKRGDWATVRSLRRKTTADETCWCEGNGWWLSTAPNA